MRFDFSSKRLAVVIAATLSFPVAAQTVLDSEEQKVGYSVGANIGYNLSSQGIVGDLDIDALIAGLRDGMADTLQMDEEEIVTVLQQFQASQQAKAMAAQEALAQQGRDFLVENATRPEVITTESGLQYEVLSETTLADAPKPLETDTVSVHYHGTLIDGTIFDSSVDRGEPLSFPLNGVIPGWTEGLQLMSVGDKYRLFVPSELGYGSNPVSIIPANSVLVFDVELLEIQ
ncbi:MAG TPA: FKBP-type peptidyl-prolyl cis-trans isomerase [Pseudomonadaceae bacterium]|nr:FKBP-type peptidyl-prolyl cis-trans isomerase [Pseudomonadaceae bacterium]